MICLLKADRKCVRMLEIVSILRLNKGGFMLKRAFCLILSLFFISSSDVFAVGSAGFENASFSSRQLAQSGAGTADAIEPAAISYNPAGITQLKGIQFQANAALLSYFTRHSRDGNSTYSRGTINVVPTSYFTINPGRILNDRLVLGVGMDSPFGLRTRYSSTSPISRYTGFSNYLKMYSIKPTIALKVTEWLSVGGGPVYYRVFDFGGVLAYPNKALGNPAFPDGQVRVNLKGNTWGWQGGVLLKPHTKHQVGFYFRSPVTVHTRGQAKVENATVGGNFETGANAKLDLPLNFTVAYAYKPTNKTTIATDFGYTRWSAHKRLYINADPVNAADDALLAAVGKNDKDYQDGFSLQIGGNHKFTDKFTLMAGGLYYWSVIPNDHYIPAVPDANSFGLSIGAGYAVTKNFSLEMAYFNRFYLRRRINNSISENVGGSVDGTYTSYLQELMLSFTYKFGESLSKIISEEETKEQKNVL